MQHGIGSVYQEEVHIPLLVKFPGQHDARRANALVNHVDLMPAALNVVGCQVSAGLQGRILKPRLRGFRRAAFRSSLKLIMSSARNPELYDLTTDPGESRNQYRPGDPVATSLLARLTAWTAAIPSQLFKPAKLDKPTMERINRWDTCSDG